MRGRKATATPCSHAEFDALPYSVQRKYFSSLERLQIAKQHSLDLDRDHHHHSRLAISRRPSRAASIAFRRSLTAVSRSRRRHLHSQSLPHSHDDDHDDHAEAQFFLSLPEKLRKQYFSQEEQILLIGRLAQSHRLLSTSSTTISGDTAIERAQQRFSDFHFDFFDDSNSSSPNSANPFQQRGRTRRRSSSVSSISPCRATSFHDKNNSNHRYSSALEDGPQLQTPTLDQEDTESSLLHLDVMTPPATQQAASPLSGFRRTMSMTTHTPIRNSTSSAPTMIDSPLFGFGNTRHQRAASASVSGRRSSHTPTAPVFDPEATHYRDPEARKKLRMFLASPQKFDEAVEFGFPSTSAGDDTISPPRAYQLPPIKTDSRNFSRDMQTFLRDDKISFLEDNEEEDKGLSDGDSMADLDSPVTPSSTGLSFRVHPRKVSSSLDSTGMPPISGMGGRLNREMTLRMTLTRPDLRADEDQLYGWQGRKGPTGPRDDPFALEELHLTDDMTGTKGAFYVKPKPQGNLVTRLFKRASRKGR